ncbi:LuxR C-terminal-related transcriptional regulator [Paludibaculum fermentans]|uniref:LuxR C-terminal-related transcriptional regulator n=1 Tax=Paludibaculum fermentans TaxID=1473598 RepID=UPI003EBD2C12
MMVESRPSRPEHPIRLFIVDDHALFREGLIRLLASDETLHVAGAVGSAADALDSIPRVSPDVLILDYDLGESTAVHLLEQLRARRFTGRTLLVTAGLPDSEALRLIREGVSGIFHKHQSPEALHRCIREVAAGRILIEQEYLRTLVQSGIAAPPAPAPRLTERDKQILRCLLEGLSNKEIATHLLISESAVKASLQQLFAKTEVRTRSQLVRLALEQFFDEIQR